MKCKACNGNGVIDFTNYATGNSGSFTCPDCNGEGQLPEISVDQLLEALLKLHAEEQFGDCVEDGEVYPCKTVKLIQLFKDRRPCPGAWDGAVGATDPCELCGGVVADHG